MINNKHWIEDLNTARRMLVGKKAVDSDWLNDVISQCSHSERIMLRDGLSQGPKSLWYDYDKQEWI